VPDRKVVSEQYLVPIDKVAVPRFDRPHDNQDIVILMDSQQFERFSACFH
jgi:hypothetical protein